ncbi:MAG: RNA methyltransferase [Planctomycetales bacterium]
MVERARRGKRRGKLLGSHQRCWIWGRHVVLETLRAGRWPVLELWLADRLSRDELDEAGELAAARGYPVTVAGSEQLVKRCRSHEHQGYVARMPPFPYDAPDALLAARPPRPLYVVLDRLHDPFNFGAILRCADALGVDGVFVDAVGQAEVSSQVARSSAGAVNHLRLAKAAGLVPLLGRLREVGVAVVAADEQAERALFDCNLRRPAAIVIGNEGTGIRQEVLAACDERVRIPQQGRVASLNAAVSAGILLYEAARQRAPKW